MARLTNSRDYPFLHCPLKSYADSFVYALRAEGFEISPCCETPERQLRTSTINNAKYHSSLDIRTYDTYDGNPRSLMRGCTIHEAPRAATLCALTFSPVFWARFGAMMPGTTHSSNDNSNLEHSPALNNITWS